MERPLALRGHKRLYPDDDGGDEFGTDQSQEQSVVFVLFLISNNNSYLHKTTINRQNKLVTRVSDSPRVSLSVNGPFLFLSPISALQFIRSSFLVGRRLNCVSCLPIRLLRWDVWS